MAWSTTAPELPSGSAWEQEKSVFGRANHWSLSGKLYIARLNGRQFAVKAELMQAEGTFDNLEHINVKVTNVTPYPVDGTVEIVMQRAKRKKGQAK